MRGLSDSGKLFGRTGGDGGRPVVARGRWARRGASLIFAVLVIRLYSLQVLEHEHYLELAKENVLREEILPAIRGVIRDRTGQVLVDSEPSCALAVDPFDRAFREPGALDAMLARLSPLAGVPAAEMAATIAQERSRSYLPVVVKRRLDPVTVAQIEEHRDALPGVSIRVEPLRRYVHGSLAAHLLGYVGEITEMEIQESAAQAGPAPEDIPVKRTYQLGDVVGRAGIEQAFEARLGGRNGVRMVEVNALGRRVESLAPLTPFAGVKRPVPGEDLILTLDLELQRALELALPDSLTGAAVALDARTGGILAAVSRPSFDPNDFAMGLSGEAWSRLHSDPRHPFLNRFLRSAYPPGSVFKVVTAAAGLTRHAVGPWDYLQGCVGGYQFGSRFFGCHHVHGGVTFADAMMVSCDTYFYQVGLRLGVDVLADYAHRFGLGQPTGLELKDRTGFFPSTTWYDKRFGAGRWSRGVILNLSIGQGEILATPLQLAVLMAATGTGQVVTPHVVERFGDREVPVPPTRPLEIPEDVRQQLVQALTKVVEAERGTGKRSRVPGIKVAGKTGTAQNPHGDDHAVFAAFAPAAEPEVAVAVVLENIGHGGEFAAPVAGQFLCTYFGVEPANKAPAVPGSDGVVTD